MSTDKLLNALLDSVVKAGLLIKSMQCEKIELGYKNNNELVTQADIKANEILECSLLAQFPEFGWLSEESSDNQDRLERDYVFIVDPIDGTKEYAQGLDEYAVSVALIHHQYPIMAAVYNPARKELYHAVKGNGAYKNHQRINCKQLTSRPTVLASRSEYQRGEWSRFNETLVKPMGSIAYKLALVAAGVADCTFTLQPKHEWDIAAGALLVEEAGGIIVDDKFNPLRFNQKTIKFNGVIASSRSYFDDLKKIITSMA